MTPFCLKRFLPLKLERFQNLISSVENNSLTDFLNSRHSILELLEDDYLEFINFLKEYQEQYEFSDSEKDSIRISIIRYISIAIREGLDFNINEDIW